MTISTPKLLEGQSQDVGKWDLENCSFFPTINQLYTIDIVIHVTNKHEKGWEKGKIKMVHGGTKKGKYLVKHSLILLAEDLLEEKGQFGY